MAAQPTSDPHDPSATCKPREESSGRRYLTDAQRQAIFWLWQDPSPLAEDALREIEG